MNSVKLVVPAAAAALLVPLVPAVAAAQGPRSPRERFALFASCAPMNVEVFVSNSGGPGTITEGSVRAMATSRLQAAGIYAPADSPAWSLLRVSVFAGAQRGPVNTVQTLYIIRLTLSKLVYDHLSDPELAADPRRLSTDSLGAALGWIHWATTWESPRLGVGFHSGAGDGPITRSITTMLDEFVGEYLRANEEWCA